MRDDLRLTGSIVLPCRWHGAHLATRALMHSHYQDAERELTNANRNVTSVAQ